MTLPLEHNIENRFPIDEPIPLTTPTIETLSADVALLGASVAALNNKLDDILGHVGSVAEKAGPLLASLENSPLVKMLGGK